MPPRFRCATAPPVWLRRLPTGAPATRCPVAAAGPSRRTMFTRGLTTSSPAPSAAPIPPAAPSSSPSPPRPTGPTLSAGPPDFAAWRNLGLPDAILARLASAYPHVHTPTEAQRALLLSAGRGVDVFLKDTMGRGKTLALALTALSLASPATQVAVLVPTLHLQHQLYTHLQRLSPSPSLVVSVPPPSLSSGEPFSVPPSGVLIATPRAYLAQRIRAAPTHVLIDEPDAALGPIPGPYVPAHSLPYHPIHVHPPALGVVLDDVLCIARAPAPGRPAPGRGRGREREPAGAGAGALDFSRRRPVQTVWVSATLSSSARRLARNRGWVRDPVLLDYTASASAASRRTRDAVEAIYAARQGAGATADTPAPAHETGEPEHYAVVVNPATGDLTNLDPDDASLLAPVAAAADGAVAAAGAGAKLNPLLVEALALLHATTPPPAGTVALALAPEGTSLGALEVELLALDVRARVLRAAEADDDAVEAVVRGAPGGVAADEPGHAASGVPDDVPQDTVDVGAGPAPSTLSSVAPTSSAPPAPPPPLPLVFIAPRSALPGLHLARLHTVYLLGGLDVAGLSAAQRKRGGEKDRAKMYAVAAGRLGRLGTAGARAANAGERVAGAEGGGGMPALQGGEDEAETTTGGDVGMGEEARATTVEPQTGATELLTETKAGVPNTSLGDAAAAAVRAPSGLEPVTQMQSQGPRQRVVSLVLGGSADERALFRLFFGKLGGARAGGREDSRIERVLRPWVFDGQGGEGGPGEPGQDGWEGEWGDEEHD
ncbi:hypothetical protein Q5752_007069 [Cryptotrichosporon argae]